MPDSSKTDGASNVPTDRRSNVMHRNRRALLVGESYHIAHALTQSAQFASAGLSVVDTVPVSRGEGGFPHARIRQSVLQHGADTILVAGDLTPSSLSLFGELAVVLGCRLCTLPAQGQEETPRFLPVWDIDAITGRMPSASRNGFRFHAMKRGVDVLGALVGLLVAWPVIALAAVAVRLDSPGRAFFGHLRIGRGGKRFRCWKLRTMHTDAERRLELEEALRVDYFANDFKLPEAQDPRITRVGRLLRKTSLDELPQLLNVLMGDMSLVGPRPVVAEELLRYRGEILTLLSVRPGLTGAWAVNGRHDLAYPERVQVELGYVHSQSLFTDLCILVRTVGAVLHPGAGRRMAAGQSAANVAEPAPAQRHEVSASSGHNALG